MRNIHILRIVAASAGDVKSERHILAEVVDEINRGPAAERALRLELFGWDTDSYPEFHPEGPQERRGLIEPLLGIKDYDIFIGIFWKRFGAVTGSGMSGAEQEIQRAYESWREHGRPLVSLYLKQQSYSPKTQEEIEQWGGVLNFRQHFAERGLWWSYRGKTQFRRMVLQHLTDLVLKFPTSGAEVGPIEHISEQDERSVVEAYRKRLAERLGGIYLFGEAKPHSINKVFVELNIEERQPSAIQVNSEGTERGLGPKHLTAYEGDGGGNGVLKGAGGRRAVKPTALLRGHTQAVLVGEPGFGKTTLLKHLTLKTIESGERFPVFLELKTLTKGAVKQARGNLAELLFNSAVANSLYLQPAERAQLKRLFIEHLAQGRAAIFLDGLDEVRGQDLYMRLCVLIGEFMRSTGHHNTLLVSTRPNAIRPQLEGLREFGISPLNRRQVEEFLKNYHGDSPVARRLSHLLLRNAALNELARTPLLLLIISQLYQNDVSLSEDRLMLYQRIVEQLNQQWDQSKGTKRLHFLAADAGGMLRLEYFRQLAFESFFAGGSGVERAKDETRVVFTGKLLEEKARRFLNQVKRPDIEPLSFVSDVRSTPLLREIGADVYAFAHQSIQEYLAAEALSKQEDFEKLLCRAYFNPTLVEREVLPMALGLAQAPDELYAALEQLPESLSFSNLQLRARGLAYVREIRRATLNSLAHGLITAITDYEADEYLHRNRIVESFASIGERNSRVIIEGLISALHNSRTSLCAALALGEIGGERALEVLLTALNSEKPVFRMDAALALSKIPDERAVLGLIKALDDESSVCRWWATDALGEISDRGAVKKLLEVLRDKDTFIRWHAARALARIAGKETLDGLRALREEDNSVRGPAAYALALLGDDEAVNTLLEVLKDADDQLRVQAAAALEDVGDERAVEDLLQALTDNNIEVRANVADALTRIDGERAVEGLIKALDYEDVGAKGDVRWRAAEALGEIGGERASKALLLTLKHNEHKGARWRAAEALGKIGGERAKAGLLEALNDEDKSVRQSAALALGSLGDKRSLSDCIEALEDSDIITRLRAVEALGVINGQAIVVPLLATLDDDDFLVRQRAAEIISGVGKETLATGLLRALLHERSFVRRRAARVLCYYSEDERVIRDLSQLATSDPSSEVRSEASIAREKFYRKLQYVEKVVTALPIAVEVGREKALEETREFIAHEIKSAIGPLKVIAEMLVESLSRSNLDRNELVGYAQNIVKQTNAAYEVVNRYVDFTKPLKLEFKETDINQLLRETLNEIQAECTHHNIVVRLQSTVLPKIPVDRTLISQMLRNVLRNAIEAIGRNGGLTVTTRLTREYVRIEISDTGTGVRQGDIGRLFEAGFTTKSGKRGAGLGLALSRRIVEEAHRGRISIANNPDVGARVRVELPVTQEERINGKQSNATARR
jgi:HEAT repeat protein